MRQAIVVAVMLAAWAAGARAQTPQTHVEMWSARIDQIEKLRAERKTSFDIDLEEQVTLGRNITAFLLFAHAQNMTRELRLIEDARTDKQVGAPPATGGGTSVVSKGAVPSILGFAVEHGALTQAVNSTSITLRGELVGWLDLLKGQDFIAAYADDSPFVRQLRRVSYSLTYNAAPATTPDAAVRPSPEAVEQKAKDAGRQLTAYSVRFTFLDRRNPRRQDNRDAIRKLISTAGAKALDETRLVDDVFKSPEYDDWLKETVAPLRTPAKLSRSDIEFILYRRLELLRQIMVIRVPDFHEKVAQAVGSMQSYESARARLFKSMAKRAVVAAELVRDRPATLAHSTTYRLIADGVFKKGVDVTANAAVTVQDSGTALVPQPVAIGGIRDVQLAAQVEIPIGKEPSCTDKSGLGKPAIALEYLSQKILEDAVVKFAGHDFSVTPGWIHVAQVKVVFPFRGSGIKIPLSVSFANRTELLREKNVRAHIGLTFDMDVLASAVRR